MIEEIKERTKSPFVISMHHRCGSKWAATLLSVIFKELGISATPVDTTRYFSQHKHFGFTEFYEVDTEIAFIANCNYKYLPDGTKGINVYRDPRDQLISCYFAHLYSHQTEYWPQLIPHRDLLKSLSQEAGIQEEMDFSHEFIEDLGSFDLEDGNFEHFNLMNIGRYKDSVGFFIMTTLLLYGRFGFTTKEARFLSDLCKESTFIKLSGGRQPGETDKNHHFRNGKAGDWKNYFSEENKEKFKDKYNYILLKYGFEQDENW